MKILILEDNQERINKMKELFKNQELFIFDNVIAAFMACKEHEFDVCLLDHDLDQRIWVSSNEENTGYNFVRIITNHKLLKNSTFYIHSMNPIGANKMLNLLLDEGYDGIWYPFYLWRF